VHNQYKRARKLSSEPLDDSKRTFLASLLEVILEKMKWDESVDPDDIDEDDKVAFEDLRKVLGLLPLSLIAKGDQDGFSCRIYEHLWTPC
jgi:hypothetical protein